MTKWQCVGCGNVQEAEARPRECRCGCRILKETETPATPAPSSPPTSSPPPSTPVAEPAATPARASGGFPAWAVALFCGMSVLVAGVSVWRFQELKGAWNALNDKTVVVEERADRLEQELADAEARRLSAETNVMRLTRKQADAENTLSTSVKSIKQLEQDLIEAKAKQTEVEAEKRRIEVKLLELEAKLATPPVVEVFTDAAPYMVIDLSGGPSASQYNVRYTSTPPGLNDDTCRTTEMWLRLIPKGSFMMGSPADELGRHPDEAYHHVTLTQPFYMGVFEVTQRQYELVMGTNPSTFKGATRPVESVSYNSLRGSVWGSQWPANDRVDESSFFGKLHTKIPFQADLPTEAQWEYACRAGMTKALNNGYDVTGRTCWRLAEVGRYDGNINDFKGGFAEHTKVGQYLPNAWGLYDMHGNVGEMCLDRYQNNLGTFAVTNPRVTSASEHRVMRGGSYFSTALICRSAYRHTQAPGFSSNQTGFRVCVLSGLP